MRMPGALPVPPSAAVLTCTLFLANENPGLGGSQEGKQTRVCAVRFSRRNLTPRPPSSVTCTPRSGLSLPLGRRVPLTSSCIGRAWRQVYFELVPFRGLPEGVPPSLGHNSHL